MSRNDKHTKENLLDYWYHQSHYKLIDVNLSRQASTTIPQQINFTRKLKKVNGGTISFIVENQQKTFLNFSLDYLNITE